MKRALSMIMVLLLLLAFPTTAYAATSVPNSVIQATESVVRIFSEYRYDMGSGSGFVVKSSRSETLIATNYHVVEGSPIGIYIISEDGEFLDAHILASDKNKDICILSLDTPLPMKALRFDTKPRQGEAVYAVGFPAASDAFSDQIAYKSEEATITDGIISSLRQFTVDSKGNTVSALQISAAINPGNSGGPLLNGKGQVLGIDTWGIDDSQGIFGAVAISELTELASANGIRLGGTGLGVWLLVGLLAVLVLAVLVVVLIRRQERKTAGTGEKPAWEKRVKTLDLSEYIDRLGRPLLPQEAVSLLMPAIVQLKELHDKGRPHLQLRPESFAISRKEVRLIEPKAGEANYYTVGFAAPELYKGKNYGSLTDIYSLCAVLLYAVTGINPAMEVEKEENRVDEEFMELLAKGMQPGYAERYGSVQELIFKLSPYHFPGGVAQEVFRGAGEEKPKRAPREKEDRGKTLRELCTVKKKAICDGLVVFFLFLGCVGGYFGCYLKAGSLADEGEFSKAHNLLFFPAATALHDGKMSQYIRAGLLLEQGEYVRAQDLFQGISGYRESIQMIKECIYHLGLGYMEQGEYFKAEEEFREIIEYRDARELLKECIFKKALRAADEGNFKSALTFLSQDVLKDYPGIDEQIEQIKDSAYEKAVEYYRNSNRKQARELFELLSPYKDSDNYLLLIRCASHIDNLLDYERDELYKLGLAEFEDAMLLYYISNH